MVMTASFLRLVSVVVLFAFAPEVALAQAKSAKNSEAVEVAKTRGVSDRTEWYRNTGMSPAEAGQNALKGCKQITGWRDTRTE